MRAAMIFARFGPYHVARLEAAGRRLAARDGSLTGIEVARTCREYGWLPVEGGAAFRKVTLFDQKPYERVDRRARHAALTAALDAARPDVIAIPGWSAEEALTALRWAGKRGTPVVLMSESARADAARRAGGEAVKRRLVRACATALVGGRRHADYLAELGMARARVFAGYDVVDNAHFARGAAEARAAARARRAPRGLPEHYFLASSRFIPKKNLVGLLEAFARYRRSAGTNGWGLVLCGDGPLRPALEARVAALGLREAVTFAGFVDYAALPDYYGLADIFVHASLVEQWGLVVNEAMAAGLPVLVSERCGCVPELVADGKNGFTFEPGNVAGLAALMARLAERPDERASMGAAGSARIAAWSPERFAEGFEHAAETALGGGMPRLGAMDRLLITLLMCRS